ncbi:unnamed protein product [Microthlaspi erraticum]|uniref:Reverse transcriptase zinc-binding domain-containing protein n=1 Tax=Microthlaspi erraticum TaxID=1685480 RepID=A0A6D2HHX9_9BRAS|nr:unnamed protein product [Microthlaspi erraticum]
MITERSSLQPALGNKSAKLEERLATGVRMRSWGQDQPCLFCGERDEARDHLFFACPYTYTLWSSMARGLLGNNATPDWSDTLQFIMSHVSGTMDSILLRLLFQTVVYYIWRERNARRHRRSWVSVHQLGRTVDKAMRNRISSLHYTMPHKLEGLLRRWFEKGQTP